VSFIEIGVQTKNAPAFAKTASFRHYCRISAASAGR